MLAEILILVVCCVVLGLAYYVNRETKYQLEVLMETSEQIDKDLGVGSLFDRIPHPTAEPKEEG